MLMSYGSGHAHFTKRSWYAADEEVSVSVQFSKPLRWVRQTVADPSGIWRYGFAVVAVVAAAGVRLAFNPILAVQGPYMPFYCAVIIAALFGGRGPGLAATVASGLFMHWLFLKPA